VASDKRARQRGDMVTAASSSLAWMRAHAHDNLCLVALASASFFRRVAPARMVNRFWHRAMVKAAAGVISRHGYPHRTNGRRWAVSGMIDGGNVGAYGGDMLARRIDDESARAARTITRTRIFCCAYLFVPRARFCRTRIRK